MKGVSDVITNAHYGVEPWVLTEDHLDLDVLAQSESVFALSNGHIGLRGNLDEGEPFGLPGTYLNSLYEERPLPYAEAGYGFPQVGQTVINVTNGKVIRLLVNDEPFDIRYGTVHSHVRTLDLRAGTLTRHVDWTSPAGNRVRISSVRLVSLTQRAVAAICYTVTPVDETLRLVVMSEIVANEEIPLARGRPARGRGPGRPAGQRGSPGHQRRAPARGPRAQHARQQAADGGRDEPRDHRAVAHGGDRGVCPRPGPGARRGGGGARRGAVPGQVPGLRVVLAALPARARRPGHRRPGGGAADRLGRAAGRAAVVPERLLGRGRRRGRRGRGDPAGRPVRAVPHPAGRGAGGEPADPGEGADRDRV